MAKFKIPNNAGTVRQLNVNDTSGELWSTYNIDIHTNPGKIKLARPFKKVVSDTTLSGDDVEALAILNGFAYALTNTGLFRDDAPFTSWSLIDPTPQGAHDMVVFGGQLVVNTETDLDAFNGSSFTENWWTARGNPSLTGSGGVPYTVPHMLEVLQIGEEKLAVTDGSEVHSYRGGISSGAIVSATVDLGTKFVATCIKGTIRTSFIGTYTLDGDQAYVFEWDGASTNYTQAYPVGAKAVLSMEIIDDVPLIVTERGEIKIFNNAGFSTVAQFPFATKPLFVEGVETGLIQSNNLLRPIHPKGMRRAGNVVYIYANFDKVNASLPVDERTPSGVWTLNLSNWSLNHLGSQDGEQYFQTSSPIMVVNESSGRIFLGGRRDIPNTTTDENGVWVEDLDDDSTNQGYYVTPEIEAEEVQDVFNKIVNKAFLGEDDVITVKYRTAKDANLPAYSGSCVWINTTTFNTTNDLSYIKERFDAGHRDEVEIILGNGAGKLAHITSIETSTTVYSVTVDEAIGTTNSETTVRFDNWKKVPKTMTATDGEVKTLGFGSDAVGPWAQFKVQLSGKAGRPEVRKTLISTNPKEKV